VLGSDALEDEGDDVLAVRGVRVAEALAVPARRRDAAAAEHAGDVEDVEEREERPGDERRAEEGDHFEEVVRARDVLEEPAGRNLVVVLRRVLELLPQLALRDGVRLAGFLVGPGGPAEPRHQPVVVQVSELANREDPDPDVEE